MTGLRPFYIPDPSEPSNVVKPSYPPLTPGSPTIVGTAVVGSSLTAHEGTWATDQFTYQWLRDGASIGGATKRVYAISAADAGHAVAVRVTGSRTGYSSTSATSSGVAISAGSFSVPTLPSFTGTYALGRVLTAAPGTWSPAPTTYAYQWYRNGDAILGATSATYALTSADQGTKISVVVTASKVGYNTLTKNSAQVTMPKFFTTTPTPTISGTLRSGHTLTAKPGTWSPSATLTYQWYRNGAKISKATKSTYELTTTDRGKKITVVVTGKKTGYGTIAMTSAAKTVYYEFSKAPTPTISGTLKSGHTLTAKAGTWSPTPTKTYQWYRSGKAIAGATKSTYKLTSSDKGKKITVKVTGKRTGYLTVTKTSAAKTVAK